MFTAGARVCERRPGAKRDTSVSETGNAKAPLVGSKHRPACPQTRLSRQREAKTASQAHPSEQGITGGSPKRASHLQVGLVGRRDSGKNLCAGTLYVLQRFCQRLLVAGIELDVVSGILGFEADGFADDKCNGFRLCLTDTLRRLAASILAVKERVSRLMGQRSKFLCRTLTGQQHNLSR